MAILQLFGMSGGLYCIVDTFAFDRICNDSNNELWRNTYLPMSKLNNEKTIIAATELDHG